MRDYLKIADSPLMLFLVSFTLLVVAGQSLLFIRRAWKEGAKIGIETALMKKSMINSAIFSVVPSLPILIMLVILSNSLGRYFIWLRLSVVGSAAYESMAANIAATSVGLSGFGDPNFNLEAFSTVMYVMTFGIVWGIIFNIFFMKSLDKFSKKMKAAKNNFVPVFSAALFMGILGLMSSPHITNFGNIPALTAYISSAIMVLICSKLAKGTRFKAIDDFSLPIGMIFGMAMAIVTTNLIG